MKSLSQTSNLGVRGSNPFRRATSRIVRTIHESAEDVPTHPMPASLSCGHCQMSQGSSQISPSLHRLAPRRGEQSHKVQMSSRLVFAQRQISLLFPEICPVCPESLLLLSRPDR